MIREIYGKKIGMTQIFNKQGNLTGVTLVEVEPVCILEKIEYPTKSVVKIGCFKVEERRVGKIKKPVLGYFNKMRAEPYKLIKEVTIEGDADFSFLKLESKDIEGAETVRREEKGSEIQEKQECPEKTQSFKREVGLEIFSEGCIVDVRAKTKGRGFAGGMKRHGWRGQPRTHGHTSHRRVGSVGANTTPGRIVRGHRMPGHMGNSFRTTKNLLVSKVDKDKCLLFIKGSIPGSRGGIVRVRKIKDNGLRIKDKG